MTIKMKYTGGETRGSRAKKVNFKNRRGRCVICPHKFSTETGRALAGGDMANTTNRRSYRRCRRDHYPALAKSRRMVRGRK